MGWTDDIDTEGLVEENPFVFIIIGIIGAIAVTILHFVGIDYQPGWFQGQNLLSTIGLIFLIVFIPAIALSTLTGRSDLVKWEAIFLLISVALIFIGNNFDFDKFLEAIREAKIFNTSWDTSDVITAILIATIGISIIATAFTGKGFSIGTALIVLICFIGLGIINFPEKLGGGTHQFISNLIGGDFGKAVGIGGLATGGALITYGAIAGSMGPIGIGAFAIGAGIYLLGANMGWW